MKPKIFASSANLSIYKLDVLLTSKFAAESFKNDSLIKMTDNEYKDLLASQIFSFVSPNIQFNRNFLGDRWAHDFSLERFGPDSRGTRVELSTGKNELPLLFFSVKAIQETVREIHAYKQFSNPEIQKLMTEISLVLESQIKDSNPVLIHCLWPSQEYE